MDNFFTFMQFLKTNMEKKIEILKFDYNNQDLFKQASNIRQIVFCGEQKCPINEEFDGLDNIAIHYIIKLNGEYVATSRRRETSEGIKLERFAVLKQHRGKSLASKILKYVLNDINDKSKLIYLNAQIDAMPLYTKFGFEKIGNQFVEANILHYKMILKK